MPDDSLSRPALLLRHQTALSMMSLATAAAEAMGKPQCITLCDVGGTTICQLRMDGARLNALAISEIKARTAVSTGGATAPDAEDLAVALACGGRQTGLEGGLPIWLDGQLVGGIGISSWAGSVDRACAEAAFAVSPRLSWNHPA